MRAEALGRHALVSLRGDVPDPLPTWVPDTARTAWEVAGRPLVVRRGDGQGGVPLGFALPPAMGKGRIALVLPIETLAPRAAPGPTVAAPPGWGATLAAAEALARRLGVGVRPFGALMWQSVTGLTYLRAGSDLDLLWDCPKGMPPDLPAALSELAARAPMPLDGEIVVAGWGVQWRELSRADPGDQVLCRGPAGVEMRPAGAFGALTA